MQVNLVILESFKAILESLELLELLVFVELLEFLDLLEFTRAVLCFTF